MTGSAHGLNALVGSRIRAAREAKNISQKELALHTGIELQKLIAYECGVERVPSCDLSLIALALEQPIAFFFRADDASPISVGLPASAQDLSALREQIRDILSEVEDAEKLRAILILAQSAAARPGVKA